MKQLRILAACVVLAGGGATASAADIPNLVGSWTPAEGVHMVDGESRHAESGTTDVAGHETAQEHSSEFAFRFEGQDGRRFWGSHSSAKVSEKLIGAISVDGKRFVMTDHDGTFSGTVIDADTLDFCYTHVAAGDMAVACGLLRRDK